MTNFDEADYVPHNPEVQIDLSFLYTVLGAVNIKSGNIEIDTDKLPKLVESEHSLTEDLTSWSSAFRHAIRLLVTSKVITPNIAMLLRRNFSLSASLFSAPSTGVYSNENTLYYEGDITTPLTKKNYLAQEQVGVERDVTWYETNWLIPALGTDTENIDIRELAMMAISSHEYGHLFHNGIARLATQLENIINIDIPKKIISKLLQISAHVQEMFPIPIDMKDTTMDLDGYAQENISSSDMFGIERISVGFEHKLIECYLREKGKDNIHIDSVLKKMRMARVSSVQDFKQYEKTVEARGLNYADLLTTLNAVSPAHAKKLFGPIDVGYSFGLNSEELSSWLKEYATLVAEYPAIQAEERKMRREESINKKKPKFSDAFSLK